MKYFYVLLPLLLLGCSSDTSFYENVNCFGNIRLSTTDKLQSFKLNRYNKNNGMYYSYGKAGLWHGGWVNPDMFDSLHCINGE